jgi:putative transposase
MLQTSMVADRSAIGRRFNSVMLHAAADMLGDCFDPEQELLIHEHCRLHWSQAGAVVFVTFRTHDSIPREVIERWDREKREWLRLRGKDSGQHWSVIIPTLPEPDRADFQQAFDRCRHGFLDSCHGCCLLKRPDLAQIVADSLLHFDGQRYRMGDFVVMPNHVHLLAVFPTAHAMTAQCASWLHYTAFRINHAIGEKGELSQEEPFDHLVRSPEQYEHLRRYIADNPHKAGLKPGEYHYRRLSEQTPIRHCRRSLRDRTSPRYPQR